MINLSGIKSDGMSQRHYRIIATTCVVFVSLSGLIGIGHVGMRYMAHTSEPPNEVSENETDDPSARFRRALSIKPLDFATHIPAGFEDEAMKMAWQLLNSRMREVVALTYDDASLNRPSAKAISREWASSIKVVDPIAGSTSTGQLAEL